MIDNMISRDEGHQGFSLVPPMVHPSSAHQNACLVLSTSLPSVGAGTSIHCFGWADWAGC